MHKYFFILFVFILLTNPGYSAEYERLLQKGLKFAYNFQIDEAEDVFEQIIRKYPDDPRGYHYISNLYLWTYLSNKSDSIYKKFIDYTDTTIKKSEQFLSRNNKNDESVLYILGATYGYRSIAFVSTNKYLDAIWASRNSQSSLKKVIEINPENYDAYLGLGLFNFALGQVPSAFKWALSLIGFSGDKESGVKLIEKAAEKGIYAKVEASFYLSQIYSDFYEEYDKAEKLLFSITSKYPENILFQYSNAVLQIKKRNLNIAEKSLNKIITNEDSRFRQIIAFSNFLLGDVQYRKNKFEDAITFYNRFFQMTNEIDYIGIANYRIAVCYEITGDRLTASKHFLLAQNGNLDLSDDAYAKRRSEIFVKRNLSSYEIDLIKAANFSENANYKNAFEGLMYIIEHCEEEPIQAEAYYYLSDVAFHTGNFDDAVQFSGKAAALNSDNENWIKPFAFYIAAKASFKLNEIEQGRYFIKEAENIKNYDYEGRHKARLKLLNQKYSAS